MSRIILIALLVAFGGTTPSPVRAAVDQLTYHHDAARRGWNDGERVLTPATVASADFGEIWESPRLDAVKGVPPRLFASPLYMHRVWIAGAGSRGRFRSVVYAAATTGYVYAINASATRDVPPGTILWRRRLTDVPCGRGALSILATPIIDASAGRLYVTACDDHTAWQVHALDLGDGHEESGWPVELSAAAINRPGINANGENRFPTGVANLQRGALNLSADRAYLYLTFGGEPVSGWLIALDTRRARVAGAFSATRRAEEGVGGMWASGGPAVDTDGFVYVATGSSVVNALADRGVSGVYPESAGNWGQSILKLAFRAERGFELRGTYTPFDYCLAGSKDLDLGGGSPVIIELPARSSRTPHLIAHGGSKQGNAYLLDRRHLPGSLVRRRPCGEDASLDGSLLSPAVQPQFGGPGPLNVFGPYSTAFGMGDLAKSRSTAAYFSATKGRHFLFVTGSTKAAESSAESIAPGLARLEIVADPARAAYLRIDGVQPELVFQNPGSAVVSSHRSRDAIVWVLDENAPRTTSLYGASAPAPVLYAIDARTFALLWRSAAGELHTSGKYNEPVVVDGAVYVGTDRIQAFGLRDPNVPRPVVPASPGVATAEAGRGTEPAPDEPPVELAAEPRALYVLKCAPCHDVGREGVPPHAQVSRLPVSAIVEKLKFGSMQPQALGLGDADIEALAQWLAGDPGLSGQR